MNVNERQVGGDHYRAAIQHWDLVVKYNVPYLPAQFIRYVTRCHKKAKRQDLEKALHFSEKLVDNPQQISHAAPSKDAYNDCREYARANGLDAQQELLCWMALAGSSPARMVAYTRQYMHGAYPQEGDVHVPGPRMSPSMNPPEPGEPTRAYVDQGREAQHHEDRPRYVAGGSAGDA